jgi:type IV secretion system protein VirB10
VSQNVYDPATDRSLLIAQGSKLCGVYDSCVVYGQSRFLRHPGSHARRGHRRLRRFPRPGGQSLPAHLGVSAVFMKLVTGAMSYAVDQVSNNDSSGSGNSNSATIHDEMTAALAAQLGQATLQLLQKNLFIKPTLEIRAGLSV